jgi:tetratricopeptide (TPR) repeat protein
MDRSCAIARVAVEEEGHAVKIASFICAIAIANASLAIFGSIARADTPPNIWDEVKNPGARNRFALHASVRDAMLGRNAREPREFIYEVQRERLERANAETSPDVRLRFDLAEIYEQLGHHQRAVDILIPALAMSPGHPASGDAFLTLAYAYAHLDKPRDERDAYAHYLTTENSDSSRATALLNLAEAEMRLHNMREAVSGYQDAIDLAESLSTPNGDETRTLAYWGLAVALDRSGEAAAAAVTAKKASELDPNERLIGEGENVFFVPEYERAWYVGLGKIEDAKSFTDPRYALIAWRQASKYWNYYIDHATLNDPWVSLARSHAEHVLREIPLAEKRAARLPPLNVNGGVYKM